MSSYVNLAVCDLRSITTVEQAKAITEITNVALVILPKDAEPEVKMALLAIPQSNIAHSLELAADGKTRTSNGITELYAGDFPVDEEVVFITNGIVIIHDTPESCKSSLITNGLVILHEHLKQHCPVNFLVTNGVRKYLDFDEYLVYDKETELDSLTISYMKPKTLLIMDGEIKILPEVTPEMLQEKQLIFIIEGEVTCTTAVAAYLKATATIHGELNTKD